MACLFSTFLDKHPLNPKWLCVVSYNTYRIYLHITRQVWEWEKMQPRPKRRIYQNTQTWGRHVQSHGIWKTTLFNVVEPIPTLNQRNIMSMPLFQSSTFSVRIPRYKIFHMYFRSVKELYSVIHVLLSYMNKNNVDIFKNHLHFFLFLSWFFHKSSFGDASLMDHQCNLLQKSLTFLTSPNS